MALFTADTNLFIYISEAGQGSQFHNLHIQIQFSRTRRDTLKLNDRVRKNLCNASNSLSVHQNFNSAASFKHSYSISAHLSYQLCNSYRRTLIEAGFNGSFQTQPWPTVPNNQWIKVAPCSWETRPDRCFCIQERRSYLLESKDDMATQDKHKNLPQLPSTLHQHICVPEEPNLESGTWESDWVDALGHSGEDGQVSLGPKMTFGHPPSDSTFLLNKELVI